MSEVNLVRTNAVIILYNPTQNQITRVIEQSINFDDCYVIDNSSFTSEKLVNFSGCKYFPLLDNLGIAEAQNVAIRQILEDEASSDNDLIYFFDQDSIYDENLIKSLKLHFLKLYLEDQKNRVVGPCYVVDDEVVVERSTTEYQNKLSIISSGTVTNVLTLKECGLMMSQLFIDCVDHEWCWRVDKRGFKINQISSLKMSHKIGEGNLHFFGLIFNICGNVRCYYLFRNWVYLLSRNRVPSKILFKSFVLVLMRYIAYTFSNDGFSKSWYCLLGMKDGLLGRLGRREFQ